MTYLGYQVRYEESCGEEVQKWLDSHIEKNLQISYVTPVSYGRIEYPIADLSVLEGEDFNDFKCFNDAEDQCSFTTEDRKYTIAVAKLPADKWGNTATSETTPSCLWINHCDNSGNYPNDDCYCLIRDGIGEDYSVEDFIEWVELLKDDERVGKIEEEMICNGTSSSWHYITIKDELSLRSLISEYLLLPDEE